MRKRSGLTLTTLLALLLLACGTLAADETAQGSFERNLTVTAPVDLEITSGSGNIHVQTGAAGQVNVRARITARRMSASEAAEVVRRIEANPPVEQTGSTVRIGRIDDEELRNKVSIEYEVSTPKETRLQARSGSGDVAVADLQGPVRAQAGSGNVSVTNVDDSVEAQAGSGDVTLEGARGGVRASTGSGNISAANLKGDLRASAGSGDIAVRQSDVTGAEMKTGSGDITVHEVHGALRVSTGSGSISADGTPSAAWDVSAASGDVRLKVPATAAFNFEAHTASGSIAINHPLTAQTISSRKRLEGSVRGGGPLVSVKTASGNVRVD